MDAVLRFSRLGLLLDDTREDQSNVALHYSRAFIGTSDVFIIVNALISYIHIRAFTIFVYSKSSYMDV